MPISEGRLQKLEKVCIAWSEYRRNYEDDVVMALAKLLVTKWGATFKELHMAWSEYAGAHIVEALSAKIGKEKLICYRLRVVQGGFRSCPLSCPLPCCTFTS